jgi:hypothetical protein
LRWSADEHQQKLLVVLLRNFQHYHTVEDSSRQLVLVRPAQNLPLEQRDFLREGDQIDHRHAKRKAEAANMARKRLLLSSQYRFAPLQLAKQSFSWVSFYSSHKKYSFDLSKRFDTTYTLSQVRWGDIVVI